MRIKMAAKEEGIFVHVKKIMYIEKQQKNLFVYPDFAKFEIPINEMSVSCCSGKLYRCYSCHFWDKNKLTILHHFLVKHSSVTEFCVTHPEPLENEEHFLETLNINPDDLQNIQNMALFKMKGLSRLMGTDSFALHKIDFKCEFFSASGLSNSLFHWPYIRVKFSNSNLYHCVWCKFKFSHPLEFSGIAPLMLEHVTTCHLNEIYIIKIFPVTANKYQDVLEVGTEQYYIL